MLVGWEAPNTPHVTEDQWALYEASRANLLKTRFYHPLGVYLRALQIEPRTIFLLRPADEGALDPDEQMARARPVLRVLAANGIPVHLVTWNEPDHLDGRYGGPRSVDGAISFAGAIKRFVELLRDEFPRVPLISPPPLAVGEGAVFDNICGDVYRMCDYLGRHLYWQRDEDQMRAGLQARVIEARERFPGMEIFVDELGDSSNEGQPAERWTPAPERHVRIGKCLAQLAALRYVRGAAIFILGGTDDWRGFWPDEAAAEIVANRPWEATRRMGVIEQIVRDIFRRQGVEVNPDESFFKYIVAEAEALAEGRGGRLIYPMPSRDGHYYGRVTGNLIGGGTASFFVGYTNPPLHCPVDNPADVRVGLPPFRG